MSEQLLKCNITKQNSKQVNSLVLGQISTFTRSQTHQLHIRAYYMALNALIRYFYQRFIKDCKYK